MSSISREIQCNSDRNKEIPKFSPFILSDVCGNVTV